MGEEVETEHGVAGAFYSNRGTHLACMFECLCGWMSVDYESTWEEAGAEFDEHLSGSYPSDDVRVHSL